MQTFNALLFTMQNRPASLQRAFVHAASPLEETSEADCLQLKTVVQMFSVPDI